MTPQPERRAALLTTRHYCVFQPFQELGKSWKGRSFCIEFIQSRFKPIKFERNWQPTPMYRLTQKRCNACMGPSSMEEPATRRSRMDEQSSLGDDDAAGSGRAAKVDSRAPDPRSYKRSDLSAFNLLANRPVWVFDVERKAMWWANDAALTLWNAPSLDALLSRDFSDMSKATCKRLEEIMNKFREGERVSDQVCFRFHSLCGFGIGADPQST